MKTEDPIIDLLHAKCASYGFNIHKDLLGLSFYTGLTITGALLMAILKAHHFI